MKRRLVSLLCCFLFLAVQPASASPQTDADYIAAHFIKDNEFRTALHDMVVKAVAGGLSSALATRSVKIRDNNRFLALLPDTVSNSLFERVEKTAADQLVQSWDDLRLQSFADYLRKMPPVSKAGLSGANAETEKNALTLEEYTAKIAGLEHDDSFKNEMAMTAVGVMLIGLVMNETQKIDINLKAPYVADMLQVDGIFNFPNRIVRNDLIRELRGSGS